MNREKVTFLFIAGLFIPLFFILIPAKEWTAVLLILFSFILLLASRQVRTDGRLLLFAALVLAIRHGISITNVYYTPIYGAELDAATFHLRATEIASSIHPIWFAEFGSVDIGSSLYARSLGLCYRYLGESLLLGQSLSILAYVIAGISLIGAINNLGLSKWKKGLALLYGALPPAIIYESITMRESWEALFFLSVIYHALQLRKRISSWRVALIIGFGISFGLLHNGLLLYALFLVCYSLFWGLRISLVNWKFRSIVTQMLAIPLLIGIIAAWWTLAGDIGGASQALIKGESASYYETYRERGEQGARANYDVRLDTSSVPAAIGTGLLAFIFYLFAPFPWQISSAADLYAFLEGVLRFFLLYFGIKLWWQFTGERKSKYGYLLICGISLELLWSFGTANWGTAIRHHIVAYGVLVMVGGPGLMLSLIRLFNRFTRGKYRRGKLAITRRNPNKGFGQVKMPLSYPGNVTNATGE